MTDWVISIIFGYCMGMLPFGWFMPWLFANVAHDAPGSGHFPPLALLRAGRTRLALIVGVLDMTKALLAYAIIQGTTHDMWLAAAASFAALVGHTYSPLMKFQVGRSTAPLLGLWLAQSGLVWLILCAFAVGVMLVFKRPVVALLATLACAPGVFYAFNNPEASICALGSGLLYGWVYRRNINRLIEGKEPKWHWT